MSYDPDSGELFPNGKISDRAAEAGVRAKVELKRMEVGYGQTQIQHALERVARKTPVHIQSSKPGGKGKYAPGKDISSVMKPIMDEQGIRCVWRTGHVFHVDKNFFVPVACHLIHAESGQVEVTELAVPIPRVDPQGMGSAVTYGKRYTLLMALGLWTDEADDDGARAMPVDLTKDDVDSPELTALKEAAQKNKSATELVAWRKDKKAFDAFRDLSDGEQARFKLFMQEYGKKLVAGGDT
jgi:hypothetical protein